jgi:6-phosphogluconolactonase
VNYTKSALSTLGLALVIAFYFTVLSGCGSSNSHSGSTGTSSSGNSGAGSSGSGGSGSGGSGSGGSGSSSQPARFLYVTESPNNAVAGFTVDASSGGLAPTKQGSIAAGTTPVRVASDPAGKFLYVANQGSNNVSAYTIASDGTLAPVAGSPFALTAPGVDVAVDPSGKFALVAQGSQSAGTGAIAVFSIAASGALTPVPGSPFVLQHNPHAVIIDPAGNYVYTAGMSVEAFSIDQTTGALTPVPGEPFQPVGPANCPTCAGPTIAFNLAIDPTDTHLYTADSFAGSVYGFDIDASTGALTAIPGAPFIDRMPTGQPMDPAFNPYGIAIAAQGKFL